MAMSLSQFEQNFQGVSAVRSCFGEPEPSYQKFLQDNLQAFRESAGSLMPNLTLKLLQQRLSQTKFDQIRTQFDCLLFSYQVLHLLTQLHS